MLDDPFDFSSVIGRCARCGRNLTSNHRCSYGYDPKRDEEDLRGLQEAGRKAAEDMMRQVRLVSDFRDYYDHYFSSRGQEFRRISTDGPNRQEIFSILCECSYITPRHGKVRDFIDPAPGTPERLVVYLDESSHRGEGKILLHIVDALKDYPDHFASEYIESSVEACSTRLLQIGNAWFHIRYTSNDAWRSNCGDVDTEIMGCGEGSASALNLPLYAIDFVSGTAGVSYAVDFNIAPGIRHSGVENLITGKEVVEKIEQAFANGCVNWSPQWKPKK